MKSRIQLSRMTLAQGVLGGCGQAPGLKGSPGRRGEPSCKRTELVIGRPIPRGTGFSARRLPPLELASPRVRDLRRQGRLKVCTAALWKPDLRTTLPSLPPTLRWKPPRRLSPPRAGGHWGPCQGLPPPGLLDGPDLTEVQTAFQVAIGGRAQRSQRLERGDSGPRLNWV